MNAPTEPDLKEFCEMLTKSGVPVHWHEWDQKINFRCTCGVSCGNFYEHCKANNPTFSHPEEVLEVMNKLPKGKLFYAVLMYGDKPNVEAIDDTGYIDRDLITEPYALFWAAFEWLKEKEEEQFPCLGDCIHIHETVICKKCGKDNYLYKPNDMEDD